MTFIEKFDALKKKYAAKADISKLKDPFIAAQITLSDEDCGGTFYVAFIDGKLHFEPYDYHDNTVGLIISSALLEDAIKGKADPVKAYLEGSLQAWGNLDHALQLIDALKGKKKAPAKKKAEEKAEEKKEAVKKTAKKKAEKTEKTEKTEEAKDTKKKATAKKKTVKE